MKKDKEHKKSKNSKKITDTHTDARNRTLAIIHSQGKKFAKELMGDSYVESILSGKI